MRIARLESRPIAHRPALLTVVLAIALLGNAAVAVADTGETIWQDKDNEKAVVGAAGGYSGPRSTPAVADGKVFTLGVNGTVSCLDAASGKVVWRKKTGESPKFATSMSPLVVDGKCILFLDKLVAFNVADGGIVWRGPSGTPYGSPALMTETDPRLPAITQGAGLQCGARCPTSTENTLAGNGRPALDIG